MDLVAPLGGAQDSGRGHDLASSSARFGDREAVGFAQRRNQYAPRHTVGRS